MSGLTNLIKLTLTNLVSRAGPACQWERGESQTGQWGQTRRRLDAGEARHGGEARIWSSINQIDGGDALRVAGELAHRVVVAVGLGMVGKDVGDDVGGCRSSGELGVVARRHDRRSWWWLRATEVAVSTTVGSGASCGGCGHGHAMDGGEKLSATVVSTATAALQGKGEGKSVQGLTGIM